MRRAGRNNSLPPVVTGSHIDTQPTGGKFDGNYGVLAGLEVVRTLNDHGIETEAPIEVAFWTNEEGSRFVPVMMGSGVFAKAFTLEHAYAANDTEGKTVQGELERIGYIGEQEPGAHPIGSYFETHIEQGPVLEDHDDHRRRDRRAGHPLVRLHRHRHGSPRRPHAHGAAQGRAAGRREADAGGGGRARTATRRMAAARWAWCRCTRTAAT
jgi:acetylornithine deacetylase/succinyl-diaminopimelate desuccinylase-like protein